MYLEALRIALVTPFVWDVPSAVNEHVAGLARALAKRGHQPVVLSSSDVPDELARTRRLLRRSDERALSLLAGWNPGTSPPSELLPVGKGGPLDRDDGVPVLPLGRSIPLRLNGSIANIGLPVDVLSRLERVLVGGGFSVVHVHEPIAPSLSFTAIREARSPAVSTFHLTPAGLLAYELSHGVLARFYEYLDDRIVPTEQARRLLQGLFRGHYQVIPLGTGVVREASSGGRGSDETFVLYVYRGDDRRALRHFLRNVGQFGLGGFDRIVIAMHRASAERWPPRRAPRALRERVDWCEFDDPAELASWYVYAGATVLPFLGGEWLTTSAAEARATGCLMAAPDLPALHGAVGDGRGVSYFTPSVEGSVNRALRELGVSASPEGEEGLEGVDFDSISASVLEVYRRALSVAGQGGNHADHPTAISAMSRASLRSPVVSPAGWIHADLHIHTEYSEDCQSTIEDVLATAQEVGLGALAVADHDTIAGGLEARKVADETMIVVVAEEVKTAEGEVIGLFLEKEIPPGLSFAETLSLIKEQGGLVYIPHPFDRLRTTPSYRTLTENLHRIDIIETYNSRVALSSFNLQAERFAAKYRVVAGAGSDAHVLPGIGTALLRMPHFDGPEGLMNSLREADILTRRKSLVYLQSLKLLQNTLDRVPL